MILSVLTLSKLAREITLGFVVMHKNPWYAPAQLYLETASPSFMKSYEVRERHVTVSSDSFYADLVGIGARAYAWICGDAQLSVVRSSESAIKGFPLPS